MAPRAKMLVVAKDLGATSVTLPVAEIARDRGWDVGVVVEGLAGPKFMAKKFEPMFMGTKNFEDIPFTLEVDLFLEDYFPDDPSIPCFLMIGESSPTNLELQIAFAMSAFNRGRENPVRIVECQDFWRGHNRIDEIVADLYLTLDPFAQKLVMEDKRIPKERVVIVGNPGAKDVEVTNEIERQWNLLDSTHGRVFFYAGGRPDTTKDEISLLADCFRKTEEGQVLVIGPHPKYVSGTTEFAKLLPPEVTVIMAKPGTANQWVSLERVVIATGFSTLLTTAAHYDRDAIALETPATMKSLREQAGLTEIPQVVLGFARGIKKPVDLYDLVGCPHERPEPYDPQVAFQAIKDLI